MAVQILIRKTVLTHFNILSNIGALGIKSSVLTNLPGPSQIVK